MGDRGNIIIRSSKETPPVVFYTHWGGSEIGEIAARAIGRKQRWDDPDYLARIVFCELIDGDTDSETGFGIAVGRLCDNEHLLVEVNTITGELRILEKLDGEPIAGVSFTHAADFPELYRKLDRGDED